MNLGKAGLSLRLPQWILAAEEDRFEANRRLFRERCFLAKARGQAFSLGGGSYGRLAGCRLVGQVVCSVCSGCWSKEVLTHRLRA